MLQFPHVLIVRMFTVLLDQEVCRFLWDGYFTDQGFDLGAGEGQFAARVADILLADEDRAVLYTAIYLSCS